MTGSQRPKRSYYLDDMVVDEGDKVICKCSMGGNFTPGKIYQVYPDLTLMDDSGKVVVPSDRFIYY